MPLDQTFNRPLTKALSAQSTATSFTAPAPTTTEPTGNGVVDIVQGSGNNYLLFMPYGGDTTDLTFSMKIVGWESIETLWVPRTILVVSCTLENALLGVAGAAVINTEFFCDAVTWVAGDEAAVLPVVGDDNPAWGSVDITGAAKIEFEFDMTGADGGNCLYRIY